jgi:hypothetical protein
MWAGTLAAGHVPLDGGIFEFGHPRNYAGTVVERPYPAVRLDDGASAATPMPLLVAPGKHGADALIRGMDGRHVTFVGTRIHRGTHTMIEIEPSSLVFGQAAERSTSSVESLGSSTEAVELIGEIVDSKCFLGVMVPGSGKTHKECASLCLRGGIPPALYVQDRAGGSALLLLTGLNGESIGAPGIQVAGEAISVSGFVERQGGWLVLRTDSRSWRRVQR